MVITGGTNAYIWIAEDADYIADYIAESVTLPGIIPNRRNGRERWKSRYNLHDLIDLIRNTTPKMHHLQRSAMAASLPHILRLCRVSSWRRSVVRGLLICPHRFKPSGSPSRVRWSAATTAGGVEGYSLGERGGSSRADGWSGWLLATPTTHRRPEPFGTRSRATAMASLPMFAMHVWSEPSHVVAVACFPECSRALASRCLAGCRSIQTTTATNYYIQLLALAPKARP